MKTMNTLGALALAAYAAVVLSACSKTSNDSTAATPATCTMTANGTMVDQYGRYCNNANSLSYGCQGYTYSNGQYYNPQTGQPVYNCGNSNVIPSNGYYNNQYIGGGIGGCQAWTSLYGVQYVPVNVGGGSIMCVQWAYVQGYGSQYNSAYADPSYWYYYPPSLYSCDPYYGCGGGGGYGGGYGGGGYGGYYPGYGYYGNNYCAQNLSLGFSTVTSGGTGIGIGTNLCFPPSY